MSNWHRDFVNGLVTFEKNEWCSAESKERLKTTSLVMLPGN